MNAEFNWWLLIVGLLVGAGLVWFVLLDARRREVDIDAGERPREAAWLSAVLAEEGYDVSPDVAARLLELHRRYLEAPAPDDPVIEDVEEGRSVRPATHAGTDTHRRVPGAPSEPADDDRVRVQARRPEVHE